MAPNRKQEPRKHLPFLPWKPPPALSLEVALSGKGLAGRGVGEGWVCWRHIFSWGWGGVRGSACVSALLSSFYHPPILSPPRKKSEKTWCHLFRRQDGQKRRRHIIKSSLFSFCYIPCISQWGHWVPQRLTRFRSSSQLQTKQAKTKHSTVLVLLKQEPQPGGEMNNPKKAAGDEGAARRLG